MVRTAPSLTDRSLSLAYYFGLAPLTTFWRSRSSNSFVQHHRDQAMAGVFFLLVLFLVACLYDAVESFFFIEFPDFMGQIINRWGSFLAYLGYATWLAISALALLWISFVGLAIGGSTWQVPLLKRLTARPRLVRFSLIVNSLVLALVPLITVLALHATSLTRRTGQGGAVYFLYDEGIPVPRWGYALGLYRVSWQAQRNWGKGSTVLDCLTKETLRSALTQAKVIILATHGEDGYACTYYAPEKLVVRPPDTGATDEHKSSHFLGVSILGADRKWSKGENAPVNSQLQLAYIFACDAGKKASQWQEHLAPAQVVTYNRASTVWDHAFWFALTGPSQLEKLQ